MLKKTGCVVLCALMLGACGGGGGHGGGGPRETVLFGAREMPDGSKALWRTDGTASGTTRVRAGQFSLPSEARFPRMVSLNGRHYFAATRSFGSSLLWVTDGTETGTQPLESALYPGPVSPDALTRLGDILYFTASGGVGERDLWRTDGTPEGTWRLDDLVTSTVSPLPSAMVVLNEQLFMVVYIAADRRALIRYAAGEGTATLLRELDRQGFAQMVVYEGRLIVVEHADGLSHLWSIDPDTGAALSLLELPMNGALRSISALTVIGEHLYFLAADAGHGEELWVSDGTVPGTRLHTDMTPGATGTHFSRLYGADHRLLFAAATDTGEGLWAVDSAASPPRALLDMPLNEVSGNVLGTYQDSLYFRRQQDTGEQLCAVAAGKPVLRCLDEPVAPIATYTLLPLNDDLLFVGRGEGLGLELWSTRPALAGAELIMDICPGDCSAF